MRELLRAARPKQWVKNTLVFAGMIFDQQLFDSEPATRVLVSFVLTCALASSVYLLNDLLDMESDRQHPIKRKRPLAAGTLSPSLAKAAALFLGGGSLLASYFVSPPLLIIFIMYLVLQLIYNLWLKQIILLDLLAISAGFVLRVAAGTAIIAIKQFSPWLYVCTALLALYLVIGKRRQDLKIIQQTGKKNYQNSVWFGQQELLNVLLSVVIASTLIAYMIYTIDVEQMTLGNVNLALVSTVFVFYALFRYLYLLNRTSMSSAPEEILFSDLPLQISIIGWGLSHFLILYVLVPAGPI